MKKLLLLVLFVFVSTFAFGCSQKRPKVVAGVQSALFDEGTVQHIKITDTTAALRSGCSNTSPSIQSLDTNTVHKVLSKVGDWYAVKLPDNTIGFVSSGQCSPIVADSTKNTTTGNTMASASPSTNPALNKVNLTAAEQQMVNLVNSARSQNKLPALIVDMSVTNIARIKAQDMINNHYFSHYSPKYGSPFDMLSAFGIKYIAAGENIAGNSSVTGAETALMNSPGHRANILNPNFTHIGIGIKSGGPYGNMFSQMFISQPK